MVSNIQSLVLVILFSSKKKKKIISDSVSSYAGLRDNCLGPSTDHTATDHVMKALSSFSQTLRARQHSADHWFLTNDRNSLQELMWQPSRHNVYICIYKEDANC